MSTRQLHQTRTKAGTLHHHTSTHLQQKSTLEGTQNMMIERQGDKNME